MRKLLIEVDCGEKYCGECIAIDLIRLVGWRNYCTIFKSVLEPTGNRNLFRLEECLQAERKGGEDESD